MRERTIPVVAWSSLALVLAVVLGAGASSLMRREVTAASVLERPGEYGQVLDFTLTERSGRTVTSADLEGDWWVADFIFTRCTGVCPILTSRMSHLAQTIDDVRFVSFSVDPTWDTPEVLRDYAAGAVPNEAASRWLFLTGPRETIHRVVGEGFKLAVAELSPDEVAAGGELITHSDRMVLVDPWGTIRGYYRGTEQESVERLAHDLARMRAGE